MFAFAYIALGVPISGGVLYPAFGLLLSPVIASLAMNLSSVSVISNALRLRVVKLWAAVRAATSRLHEQHPPQQGLRTLRIDAAVATAQRQLP